MSNHLEGPSVTSAAAECRREFGAFASRFREVGEIPMPALRSAWEHYYFGAFASFDGALRAHVAGGGRPDPFIQLSIDHHNLHRLMEVLREELGERRLREGRIPERLLDLTSSWQQLEQRLAETCGSTK